MENSVIIYTIETIYDYLEFYYADKKIEPKSICQFPNIGNSNNYIRAYSVPYGTIVKGKVAGSNRLFNVYPLGFSSFPIFSSSASNFEYLAVRDVMIRTSTTSDQTAPT